MRTNDLWKGEKASSLFSLLIRPPLSRGQADGEKGPPRTRKAASKRKKRPFGLGEGRERSFSTTTTSAARGIAEEDRERPWIEGHINRRQEREEGGGKRKRKKARRPFEESGGDRQGRSNFFLLSLYPSPASARLELSAAAAAARPRRTTSPHDVRV